VSTHQQVDKPTGGSRTNNLWGGGRVKPTRMPKVTSPETHHTVILHKRFGWGGREGETAKKHVHHLPSGVAEGEYGKKN